MASALPADDVDDLTSNVAPAPNVDDDSVAFLQLPPPARPARLLYESESGVLGGLVAGADEPPRQGRQQRNTVRLRIQKAR